MFALGSVKLPMIRALSAVLCRVVGMLQSLSDDDAPRRMPGRPWKPGQSGNPNGRRGERKVNGMTLPELARAMTHEALEAVRTVLADPDVSHATRLQAADIVLRRGWGDAPRSDDSLQRDLTVIVQQLTVVPQPVPGVLNSPIAGHVCLPAAEVVGEVSQ